MIKEKLELAVRLYGIFPYEVLEKLYGGPLNKDEVIAFVKENPYLGLEYVDYPAFEKFGYKSGYFRPVEKSDLLKVQGDTPFYIPTKDEIDRIIKTGFNGNKYYDELEKLMKKDIQKVWMDFSAGVKVTDELNWIISRLDCGNTLDMSLGELNKITGVIIECYNHTNLRVKRGWEPVKLAAELYGRKYN